MRGFFQEILEAISDFKFYKEVKDFQVSKAIKYIFTLILLITLVLTIRYSFDFRKGLNLATEWATQNLPPINIQNGVVNVDVQQPYKIIDEEFALIIDTTGEITSLDGYHRGILLMKDRMVYKESELKTETHNLSNIDALRIDENFIRALKKNALWILFPIMLLGTFVGFCIAKFLQILIFSIISVATSSIADVKLSYKQLFNIGIYAITPSTILGAILAVFALHLPRFGLIYSGIYIIYLIMAVRNCKEKTA